MGWVSERDLWAEGVRLYCLPHAGSGAAVFYRWRRMLAAGGVNVCPVLLPGREVRLGEPSLVRVEEIVDGLQAEMKGELSYPYAVFGHSMGALLAYAWARRIAEDGSPAPRRLIVSGRNAPQTGLGRAELHRLEDEAFVEALRVHYGGVPAGFLEDQDLREVYLPILRADLEVVESYRFRAGERLTCPVTVVAGDKDRSVQPDGLAAWREVTSGDFSQVKLPGDHFYHLDGDGQRGLLRMLGAEGVPPPYADLPA